MAIIKKFTGNKIHPDDVLDGAINKMDSVMVIGYDHDGDLYVASSSSNPKDMIWVLEDTKQAILEARKSTPEPA